MNNIIIFDTAIGTTNLGDEIILDSINRNMYDVFNSGFSLRLATHVNNFSSMQMLRNNMKVKYFKSADWKFVCGTNLLAQKRVGKINSQWQIYPSNIPIFKNSILVGAGTTEERENLDFYAKFLYKKVLSKSYVHSVRDNLTKKIVEDLGFSAINTGCPTLWEMTPEHCEKIPHGKADACIFSVSGYEKQIDRVADKKMLDILEKNYSKLYAWIQTTEDEKYLSSISGNDNIERIYSLKKYKDILQKGNVDYVGTRLHGGIFALQNNCRSIIIGIDHRAEGFYETNNIPILYRKDIAAHLDEKICSDFSTDIRIEQEAINTFKKQFS